MDEKRKIYRDKNRDKINMQQRLLQRKKGIAPKHFVNKEKFCIMYRNGVPIEEIAAKFGVSRNTAYNYARQFNVTRDEKFCRECKKYPCFRGIENFETNFALTCRSYKKQ